MTRQEVAAKLSKALADREGGLTFDAGAMTVGEYLARWLSHSVRDTVSQKTYERCESIVRVHLSPALGRIRLKALTPDHVRGLYREKLDSGLAPPKRAAHPPHTQQGAQTGYRRRSDPTQRCRIRQAAKASRRGDSAPQ